MPSPASPITLLAQSLRAAPSLKGFARIFVGKNALETGRAPPSIVIYPVSGPITSAAASLSAFVDVNLRITARLWGRDIDEAWDLRARYVAALEWQKNPDPNNPDDAIAGFYVEYDDEVWDIIPDAAQQGQELELMAAFTLSASDRALIFGEVDATSATKTATLTTALQLADVTAVVDATSGASTTGVLHVDGEQMSYTGITPTTFTGLVRGISGTTSATHASGTAVSVTPT